MSKVKRFIAVIAATLIVAGGFTATSFSANAAPGDVGSQEWVDANIDTNIWAWAQNQNDPDEIANYKAAFQLQPTADGNTQCISPANPSIIQGLDNHPNAGGNGIGISHVATFSATPFANAAAYTAANGVSTFDFMTTTCAADWGLNGNWYLTNTGILNIPNITGGTEYRQRPNDGTVAASGTDGIITTPANWLSDGGDIATAGNAVIYFERMDGTFVMGFFSSAINAPVNTPFSLHGLSKTFNITVGDSITISDSELLEGCYLESETADAPPAATCDFYSLFVTLLPAGAVARDAKGAEVPVNADTTSGADGNASSIDYTGLAAGTYEFTYQFTNKSLIPTTITSYIVVKAKDVAVNPVPVPGAKPTVTG